MDTHCCASLRNQKAALVNKQVDAETPGTPTTITTPAQITAPSTGSTKQMQAMTPERSGPTVVVAQPQAPQMQAPMGGGGGGQSMPNVSSGEIELNRLMTQRLLLELAYT